MIPENSRAAKLKILFATHPKTDVFFMTTDDKAFEKAEDAHDHARYLDDKTVDTFNRRTIQADIELMQNQEISKRTDGLLENENIVLDMPSDSMTVKDLKKWLDDAKISYAASAKKDDLLKLATEAYEQLLDSSEEIVVPTSEMTLEELQSWLQALDITYPEDADAEALLKLATETYQSIKPE